MKGDLNIAYYPNHFFVLGQLPLSVQCGIVISLALSYTRILVLLSFC